MQQKNVEFVETCNNSSDSKRFDPTQGYQKRGHIIRRSETPAPRLFGVFDSSLEKARLVPFVTGCRKVRPLPFGHKIKRDLYGPSLFYGRE